MATNSDFEIEEEIKREVASDLISPSLIRTHAPCPYYRDNLWQLLIEYYRLIPCSSIYQKVKRLLPDAEITLTGPAIPGYLFRYSLPKYCEVLELVLLIRTKHPVTHLILGEIRRAVSAHDLWLTRAQRIIHGTHSLRSCQRTLCPGPAIVADAGGKLEVTASELFLRPEGYPAISFAGHVPRVHLEYTKSSLPRTKRGAEILDLSYTIQANHRCIARGRFAIDWLCDEIPFTKKFCRPELWYSDATVSPDSDPETTPRSCGIFILVPRELEPYIPASFDQGSLSETLFTEWNALQEAISVQSNQSSVIPTTRRGRLTNEVRCQIKQLIGALRAYEKCRQFALAWRTYNQSHCANIVNQEGILIATCEQCISHHGELGTLITDCDIDLYGDVKEAIRRSITPGSAWL